MRLKLAKRWTEKLMALPESGMGYQLVDVVMKDGRRLESVVVLNAEWLEVPSDYTDAEVEDLRLHGARAEP